MQEDVLRRRAIPKRAAVSKAYPLATLGGAGCLALAFGILGWGEAQGFPLAADLLSKGLIVLLVLLACVKRGGTLAWFTFFFGLLLFLELRGAIPRLGLPVHTAALQDVERIFGLGVLPSQALQQLFFDPAHVGLLDLLTTAVNWSYFVVPYLLVLGVWIADPRGVYRLINPLVLTLLISVAICAVLPAAPPWLASGAPGAPRIYAIMHLAGVEFDGLLHTRIYQSVGDPNPTACLPSVHFAVTFVFFLFALTKRRVWAILAGTYAAAMLFSLVYLGEHYLVDTLLGGVVAALAWYGYRRLLRGS